MPTRRLPSARSSFFSLALLAAAPSAALAVVSATIVPGSLNTAGAATTSGTAFDASYGQDTNSMRDFPRDTGGFGTDVYPVTLTNGDFNGNAFGGTPNTIVAFGNGGGVTLKFDQPIHATAGQKAFGLFTAQFIDAYSNPGRLFDGNMQASVLVSSDGVNYRTLTGQAVSDYTTYTATSSKLNTPSLGYNFGTLAAAYNDGGGTSAAALAALPLADYTTPVLNESLFNGSGTDADRAALADDASTADYAAVFGNSAGGNWFDVSGSGLGTVQYVRLNGVGDDYAVRLDGVFANAAAVPEPALMGLAGVLSVGLLRRR